MTTNDSVPLVHASLGARELAAVAEVFASGWPAGQGPRGKAFEAQLKQRYGVGDAVALSNCGAALHLAMLALGVEPGDDRLGVPEEQLAGLGERDGSRSSRPLDERLADDLLERRDLLADGRLRVPEPLGGPSERALARDRVERSEVAHLDA